MAPRDFYDWIHDVVWRDDDIGQLARRLQTDPAFPHTSDLEALLAYLAEHGLGRHEQDMLREAHLEWEHETQAAGEPVSGAVRVRDRRR